MNARTDRAGKLTRAWLLFLALAAFAAMGYQAVLEVRRTRMVKDGAGAADFSVEKYGGGVVRLSALRGHVVMLDFWATWCEPCKAEFPELVRLATEFEDKGLVYVAADQIDADSRAAVGVFLAQTGAKLPGNAHIVFAPNAVFDQYQVQALPTLYFIDREGQISDALQGYATEEQVRTRIEKLLAAE